MDKDTEEKLHSAMHVIAGYEYQFKYFFWKVVSLSVDDKEVSMELHDDVAVVGKEHIKMYQLKHTQKRNANGDVPNLTEKDSDLWKAISVWINIISGCGQKKIEDQLEYIENHEFWFVTNKAVRKKSLLKMVRQMQEGKLQFSDIQTYLDSLCKGQKVNESIKILKEYKLNKEFLWRLHYEQVSMDELDEKIKNQFLHSMLIHNEDFNLIYAKFFVALSEDFDKVCKQQDKVLHYNHESKHKRFDVIYQNIVKHNLKFQLVKRPFVNEFLNTTCIKQLDDIDYFVKPRKNRIDLIADVMSKNLSFLNAYNFYREECWISDEDASNFENNIITSWENAFDEIYYGYDMERYSLGKEEKKTAYCLLTKMLEKEFLLGSQYLDITASNGAIFWLSDSDTPQIGWRLDWNTVYIKE